MHPRNFFLRHDLSRLITIDNVYSSFFSNMSNGYSSPGEFHPFHELVYIDQGELMAEVGEGSGRQHIPLPVGTAYLHRPGCWHRHYAPKGGHGSMCILSFFSDSPALAPLEEQPLTLSHKQRACLTDAMHAVTLLFKQLIKTEDSFIFLKFEDHHPAVEQMLQNSMELLFLDLLLHQQVEAVPQSLARSEEQVVEEMKRYLKQNVYTQVRIEDLCQHFCYSKTTLSTWFKKASGQSIVQYFNQLKVEEAISLMEAGELSITAISEKLTFSSPQYFSRVFKEFVGVHPREFKRSISQRMDLKQLQILTQDNELFKSRLRLTSFAGGER